MGSPQAAHSNPKHIDILSQALMMRNGASATLHEVGGGRIVDTDPPATVSGRLPLCCSSCKAYQQLLMTKNCAALHHSSHASRFAAHQAGIRSVVLTSGTVSAFVLDTRAGHRGETNIIESYHLLCHHGANAG